MAELGPSLRWGQLHGLSPMNGAALQVRKVPTLVFHALQLPPDIPNNFILG